jgi:hypothetical protein
MLTLSIAWKYIAGHVHNMSDVMTYVSRVMKVPDFFFGGDASPFPFHPYTNFIIRPLAVRRGKISREHGYKTQPKLLKNYRPHCVTICCQCVIPTDKFDHNCRGELCRDVISCFICCKAPNKINTSQFVWPVEIANWLAPSVYRDDQKHEFESLRHIFIIHKEMYACVLTLYCRLLELSEPLESLEYPQILLFKEDPSMSGSLHWSIPSKLLLCLSAYITYTPHRKLIQIKVL